MTLLVIETATAACSVASLHGGQVLAHRHQIVGRGHAERLVPMIAELLDGQVPEAILVDCGPGSFTGIRVGIAAARGLAIGWNIPVHGYSLLPLIAAQAFDANPERSTLAVVMEGGHGEVFMQRFAALPLAALDPVRSMTPQAALDALDGLPAYGSGVARLAALDQGFRDGVDMLPDAAQAVLLDERFRTLPAVPIYGRAPDAKLPTAAPRPA